jgi:hypothetical protein
MSDISALSHDYEASSKLAEELNDAILVIKRSRLHAHLGLGVDQRKILASTIQSLGRQLSPGREEDTPEGDYIPQEVVERLSERNCARMAYFLDDIARASSVLQSGTAPIDDGIVQTLDEICDAADATASSVFRRMRRR